MRLCDDLFEGKLPFGEASLAKVEQLSDLTAADSHRLLEEGEDR